MAAAGAGGAVRLGALVAAVACASACHLLWVRMRVRRRRVQDIKGALLESLQAIAALPGWQPERSCVLLSGGLDSAIVAEVGAPILGLTAAFTVIASDEATDLEPSRCSAAAAGLQHHLLRTDLAALLRTHLPTAVRVLQSFDPMTLRNEVAITCALAEASALGFTCAVTGDGADELLGGYSFTHGLPPAAWAAQRARMASMMAFGSVPLGRHLGLAVSSPYTQPRFVGAALRLGKQDCITQAAHEGKQQPGPGPGPGRGVGKVPLRQLFPDVTAAARRKDPIEVGCGTTELSRPGPGSFFDRLIDDASYESEVRYVAERHGVEVRDKEHLHYYRVFRETFPNGEVPGKPRGGYDPCPKCRYELSDPKQTFCVTCGHYDAQLRHRWSRRQAAAPVADGGSAPQP